MLRVGLTGGIGSGKSSVSKMLARLGAVVIDSDILAREVVAAGTAGLAEIVQAFGPGVLTDDGELDRPAMASRVFDDAAARRQLESIIHPRVQARAAEIERAAPPDSVVVHDMPLLVETGQVHHFDVVVVVDTPTDVQRERLCHERGLTPGEADARINAQATRDQRLEVADRVVVNAGSFDELQDAVEDLWAKLTARV